MSSSISALVECPAQHGITFPTFWYRFPAIEKFLICTCCFAEKIAKTRLASTLECFCFTPFPGEQAVCNFNTGRTHQLFDYAVLSGDFEPFFSFAKRRAIMLPCPAMSSDDSSEDVRFYGLSEIEDFAVCEACYEDYVSARAPNQYFIPLQLISTHDQARMCHMDIPFVKRSLEQFSPSDDWSSFVNAAKYRLSLEACTGADTSIKEMNWCTPLQLPQMMVCELHFLDEMLLHPKGIADHFHDYDASKDPAGKVARCAFGNLSVVLAHGRLLDKDFSKWLQAMRRITTLPPCGEEIHNGEFYVLTHPLTSDSTDFKLCESCYIGGIENSKIAHHFRKTAYPGSGWCEFSHLNSRNERSFWEFNRAISTDNVTALIEYDSLSKMMHPCTHDAPNPANHHWWGTDDFLFCAECYDTLGRDNYFSSTFSNQGTFDDRSEVRCDMWSEDIQRAYYNACQSRNLGEFVVIIRDWQAQRRRQRLLEIAEGQVQTLSERRSLAASPVIAEGKTRAMVGFEARARAQIEARVKAEIEAKVKAEAEARAKAESEARAKVESEARSKAEIEARARAEIEAQARAEAEAHAKAEREARAKAESEAQARAKIEAQVRAELEAEARAEREARERAEREAEERAEREAQERADSEAQARAAEVVPQTPPKESKSKKFNRFMKGINEIIDELNAGLDARE